MATCICTLPPTHPLFPITHQAMCHFVNCHKSPLHYLSFTTQLIPQPFETITPSCRHPCYIPPFSTKVSHSKETALDLTTKSHHTLHYKVYCNSSSYDGGVGATVILYKNNHVLKSIQYKLGTPEEHTVYEVELVGIILALHLLMSLACQLVNMTLISLDNQAVILALSNQSPKPSHYLLDIIHDAIGRLHVKQDKLQNVTVFCNTIHQGNKLTPRANSVVDLQFQWVPGHKDFHPNEKADVNAKKAAKSTLNNMHELPKMLKKPLPISTAVAHQMLKTRLLNRWTHHWKLSPR